MENKENFEEAAKLLKELPSTHYTSGILRQRIERLKAHECMNTNELKAIYHLVESHIPSLRLRTVLRYEKILTSSENTLTLCKKHVAPSCANLTNIDSLLNKVKEMPAEWTLVQLTPQFNSKENSEITENKYHTNALYISVFNCGPNQPKPFCVSVDAPRDAVTGSVIELVQEIHSIISDNRQILSTSKHRAQFISTSHKQNYYQKRQSIDDRLKMLVKDLSNLYLKEWKFLLMGKYFVSKLEITVQKRIENFFKTELPSFKLEEKTKSIIQYLIKGFTYLKVPELKRALQNLFPDKEMQKSVAQFIKHLSEELHLSAEKRHPLILIIDDTLDAFPWEMMEIFSETTVSRLPSLHLAYALFQEHKETIKHGFKIIKNPENGKYIINPDLDLVNMQRRLVSFCNYWVPTWQGIAGVKPTEEQFEEMLVTGEIFSYNGHGSGSHLLPVNSIEKIRINAVALLFGCGSTQMTRVGPQTEMVSAYQVYLIACSPCIVGMLWEVTDLDTDLLATEFLSHWIPSSKVHWKYFDKNKWKKGEQVNFSIEPVDLQAIREVHEPELLKAMSFAKKSPSLSFYITRAACVARGIPVKIL